MNNENVNEKCNENQWCGVIMIIWNDNNNDNNGVIK